MDGEKQQHHGSLSEPLFSNSSSSEFATVVKELAKNVHSVSLDNQQDTMKEVKVEPGQKAWLSRSQRTDIENSWKRATRGDADKHVGIQIFFRILKVRSEMKHLFGLQKIPEGRLKYDPRFRRHAAVFTKSFDYIVKNVAYKEKLEQHFQALGERHTVFQGRGFNPEYWDTFSECMRQTVALWDKDRSHKTANTWCLLISFIMKNMRIGFDRANNRLQQRKSHTQHYSAHLTSKSKRQNIDPAQFYRQFCLNYKNK